MPTLYGYIRTSRRQEERRTGSDPESQRIQLLKAGVSPDLIFRDVGVSGSTGTNTRQGWRALDAQLSGGDVLVVAPVDRIGRRWMDTVGALRDLRIRKVRVRSLSPSEQEWTGYLDADPDSPQAVIGDVLASVFAWAAQQELESVRRRTRAAGKTLGTPRRLTESQVDMARAFRRDGLSLRQIGTALGVSRTTVSRYLRQG